MSIFSVITFGITCLFSVLDIIGFVLLPFGIFCIYVLIKRCMRKHASKNAIDLTEVICTEPISRPISTCTRPTIPYYLNTTSTCPAISYCNIPLYNNMSTIPSRPIYSFQSNLPTSPMSTFSCSTPITSSSTLPLPPFLNKSSHYMVSNLY